MPAKHKHPVVFIVLQHTTFDGKARMNRHELRQHRKTRRTSSFREVQANVKRKRTHDKRVHRRNLGFVRG